MSLGFRITSFIGRRGDFNESYVVRTVFDYRRAWRCVSCGFLHMDGLAAVTYTNPYRTSCHECDVGHIVCIGGRERN